MSSRIDLKKIVYIITILLIGVICVLLIPSNKEKNNKELSEEQNISLIKKATQSLNMSDTLAIGSITNDSMIKFSVGYMELFNEYSEYFKYDEENFLIIANIQKVEEMVQHIFNKQIDYSNVTYNKDKDNIYVPVEMTGGDAQIYKYRETLYDKETKTYIANIDCLEPSIGNYEQLSNYDKTNYSSTDVIGTIQIKYEEVKGNRILLAYNFVVNQEFYN